MAKTSFISMRWWRSSLCTRAILSIWFLLC